MPLKSFRIRVKVRNPREGSSLGSCLIADPLIDVHELVAGKLAALFDRSASRDIFDVVGLLRGGKFQEELLRLGFVVYGGASRRDGHQVPLTDVTADPVDVDRQLLPMLRADLVPPGCELGRVTRRRVPPAPADSAASRRTGARAPHSHQTRATHIPGVDPSEIAGLCR